ncbi:MULTISPECIES: hypothetical protein [Serratia]|uniref:hypothetical protein n=1 Tax=Serratia TaxID=613 RepID=UPI00117D87E4|nr:MULTISPECIES: hypothetical protein [Serratia]UTN98887.1 hypothetical protein NLX81_11760 [Serratia plymuthica]
MIIQYKTKVVIMCGRISFFIFLYVLSSVLIPNSVCAVPSVGFNKDQLLMIADIKEFGYSSFEPLNIEELDETKGKVGPLILGAIGAVGGAGASVGMDYSNGQSVNWGNATTAGVAGFVTGATGGIIGGTITGAAASAALGASAAGASNALFGSIGRGGGRSSCDTCHKAR